MRQAPTRLPFLYHAAMATYNIMSLYPGLLEALAHAEEPDTEALILCYEHGFDVPESGKVVHLRGDRARSQCRLIARKIGKSEHYVAFKCFANHWQAFL